MTYYCEKHVPDFEAKMHNVLVVYKLVSMLFDEEGNIKPFEGTPVYTLSYDEKPGGQAVGTTLADRSPIPGTKEFIMDRYRSVLTDIPISDNILL